MLEKLKAFLSLRSISIAIVFVAIVSRVIQLLFFYNLGEDLAYQVMASQNLAQGNGISLAKALPADLSITTYEALIKWPPGYSLFMYPFYEIFQHHYIVASLFVETLAAIVLIIYSRKILYLLELPVYLINVYTIVTAFFIHIFYVFPSTDGIAISLFTLALYHTLLIQKSKRKILFNAVVIILSLVAASMLKYLFMPIVFIIPVFFLYMGFVEKNRLLKSIGIISFLMLILSIGSMLMYQKSVSGSIAYVRASGVGFYPEHILSSYPFILASFIKPDTLPVITSISADIVYRILQFIQVIFLVLLIMIFLKWMRKREINKMDIKQSFVFILIGVSLVSFFSLLVLSLGIATDKISSGYWTFLQDARYYGLSIVLIQLGYFLLIHHWRHHSLLRKSILTFLFLLLMVEMFRGIGFVSNRIIHINKEEFSWQHDIRFQKFAIRGY
jgi:hypothetical protein